MSYLEQLFGLSGRAAIVTGAAPAMDLRWPRPSCAGGSVVLVDRLGDVLTEQVARFVSEGLDARGYVGEITSTDDRVRLFEGLERVDILVNNAGVTFAHPWLDYPLDAWDTTYRVNLLAPFEMCRLAARRMEAQGAGSIINVTSLNAELAFPNNPAYMAFKGACGS